MGLREMRALARGGRELSRIRMGIRTVNPAMTQTGAEGLTEAISELPADDQRRDALLEAFNGEMAKICESGSEDQVATVVLAYQRMVAVAPASDGSLRANLLTELGLACMNKFERYHALADLDAAVDARSRALEAAPADDPTRPALLQLLAHGKLIRYSRRGTVEDLNDGLTLGYAALEAGPSRPELLLSNMSLGLRRRYDLRGEVNDLAEAVRLGEQAVQQADANSPYLVACLVNYSGALLGRFERFGRQADLEAALSAGDKAVDAAATRPQQLLMALAAHALCLRLQATQTGTPADIETAVTAARRAAEAGRGDSSGDGNAAESLSNLALCLLLRFETMSSPDDLDEAVELGRQAAAQAAAFDRHRYLSNYGAYLLRRFQRLGELADLSAGIDACQAAVTEVPAAAADRAKYLGNLADALSARFQRTGAPDDLDRAVAAARAAVAAAADRPDRGSYFNALATALVLQAPVTGDGMEEADDYSRQAVEATPTGPGRMFFLSNRALVMIVRFAQAGNRADLDEAVRAAQESVGLAPPGHQFRAQVLGRLSVALLLRFNLEPTPEDRLAAVQASREAAGITTAPPAVRASTSAIWGALAAADEDWAEATHAYEAAVGFLAQVAPRGLGRADQEYELAQLPGLGSRAAACCLQLGQADLALRLLEQGRGVLLGQALDTRTDLTALERVRPDLARRFVQLREQLDESGGTAGLSAPGPLDGPGREANDAAASRQAELRRQVTDSFDAVLAEVRNVPGFEGFLLPPTVEDLLQAAEQGPVAVITVDELRSDALLLTSRGLRHVPLPGLSPAVVAEQTVEFLSALNAISVAAPNADYQAEAQVTEVLGWLWDVLAEPVLRDLGIGTPPGQDQAWPRIWWCPSGLLSFLPLHAAGHHETCFNDAPRTVLDLVSSSYTPTARSLRYARRPVYPDAASADGQVLVVAMARTPGATDLDAAPEEAALLTERFGARARVLPDDADHALATFESVRAAMPGYPWVHFACHAEASLAEPSASHLLLQDYASKPLTVLDIAGLRLEQAELAFLSACSTAMTGGVLPDEAINLASAFQLAGYRRVIATLWPVDDALAAELARGFYDRLDAAGTQDAAARALHQVMRLNRSLYSDQPSMWAAHIHSGR
jgi:hypothetical protein